MITIEIDMHKHEVKTPEDLHTLLAHYIRHGIKNAALTIETRRNVKPQTAHNGR